MTADTDTSPAEQRIVTAPATELRWSPSKSRVYMCIGGHYYQVTVTPYAEDLPDDTVLLVPETKVGGDSDA